MKEHVVRCPVHIPPEFFLIFFYEQQRELRSSFLDNPAQQWATRNRYIPRYYTPPRSRVALPLLAHPTPAPDFFVSLMPVNDRIWWKQLAHRKWNATQLMSDSRTRIFMRMSELLYVCVCTFVTLSPLYHECFIRKNSQGVIINWIAVVIRFHYKHFEHLASNIVVRLIFHFTLWHIEQIKLEYSQIF